VRVDNRGRLAGQRTVTTFQASTDLTAEYDALLLRRRSQRRNRAAALAISTVIAVLAILSVQANLAPDSQPQPMQPEPTPDVGGVPVWYDEAGLHRGSVVEQTPVELFGKTGKDSWGALALVKTGALYQDPATRDVWFHPWGGDPRIVGRNVIAGPGGDPEGDTAVWFERSELVVYDTAAGREISRTVESPSPPNCLAMCAEHYASGSHFLHVSAERVVWSKGPGEDAYTHDVPTQETSVIEVPVIDVHVDTQVSGDYDASGAFVLVVRAPDRAEQHFSGMEPRARLSPNGDYVLAVEASKRRHGATIVDPGTGDLWRVGGDRYPWIAWSYGDIALVDTEDALIACDAGRRTCKRLPAERPFLMPTT
jgi:hypothetical protein